MMKHNCNVARDLMPLVLDSAASEESQTLLDEHLEECEACKEYFSGMKAALPAALAANSEQEQKNFAEAAQKVRGKRRRRVWRNVLIGALAGAILAGGGIWAWFGQGHHTPVYPGEYNVFLSQLADGSVAVNVDHQGSYTSTSLALEEYREDGEQILYIANYRSRIRQTMENPMPNGAFTRLQAEDLDYFGEIREGTPDEYVIVWQPGDSIPAASAEMEAYLALRDQLEALIPEVNEDGKYRALTFAESQEHDALLEQLNSAHDAVPEWQ